MLILSDPDSPQVLSVNFPVWCFSAHLRLLSQEILHPAIEASMIRYRTGWCIVGQQAIYPLSSSLFFWGGWGGFH